MFHVEHRAAGTAQMFHVEHLKGRPRRFRVQLLRDII